MSPHVPMLGRVAELLVNWRGHIQLVKVRSHMGMPLNARANTQANIGSAQDSGAATLDGVAMLPLSFIMLVAPATTPISSFLRA